MKYAFFSENDALLIAFRGATCSALGTHQTPPIILSFAHVLQSPAVQGPVLDDEVAEMSPKCFLLVMATHHVLTVLLYIIT